MTKNQPFFTHNRDSDTFMPTPVANGPWDPTSLHGRVVVGLLAHVIEQRHGSEDFVPARLTVDMFRLPNTTTPIEVKTRRVRDGMRIKVVEAEFFSGGTSMARASTYCARRRTRRAMSGRRRTGMYRSLRTFQSRPIPGSA
jgi:Thioesterase-like superfamily